MSKHPAPHRRGNALKDGRPRFIRPTEPESPRVGRNATERLLAIHRMIAARRYPNTTRLAREFEVSPKTIKRDVEWMRVHWDLPIEYDHQRRGYCYCGEVKQLPGMPAITEPERFALVIAHKAVQQYRGTPFQQPLVMAFRKLTGQPERPESDPFGAGDGALSFRPFAPESADRERFEAVTQAIQQNRELRFRYRKPGEKRVEDRRVQPYHLTCNDNRWYLIGHDLDRGSIRTFALARMNGQPAPGMTFEKPADFNLDEYLQGSLTVMNGDGDYEVVIEFDAWATDQLRGRLWHNSQQVTELPGGESRLRLRLSGLEEVERWVLSWGIHATVLRPQLLVEQVGCIARALAGRYETF